MSNPSQRSPKEKFKEALERKQKKSTNKSKSGNFGVNSRIKEAEGSKPKIHRRKSG